MPAPAKIELWRREVSEHWAALKAARLSGDLYHAALAEQSLNAALDNRPSARRRAKAA